MQPFDPPFHMILIWAFELLILTYLTIRHCAHKKSRPFNFYITDIWAMMLGFAPSICSFVTQFITPQRFSRKVFSWRRGLIYCQILGMIVACVESRLRSGESLPRRLDQFALIFSGAILGFVVHYLVVVIAMTWICGICFGLLIAFPWIFAYLFRAPKTPEERK